MGSGIASFLVEHTAKAPVSFHMPGHKGSALYRRFGYGDFLDRMMDCDITEIIGADNLFQPEDIIAQTMEKYRRLYDAKASYLLVNGTSTGIIASILACVPPGKKLIMARNCHKSVFNALTLGQIQPVYAHPSEAGDYGIAGPVEAAEIRRLLEAETEAAAVILPSPNYYGICSDIQAIASVVHEAGKILIVDQAHGAHLKFFGDASLPMPPAAETCGADIVIGSIHKTLASLTQSAVLNVCTDRIDCGALEDKLQAIESTSPSYLLMASLDISAELLLDHGAQLMGEWADNLAWFYEQARRIPGLKLMQPGRQGKGETADVCTTVTACDRQGGHTEKRNAPAANRCTSDVGATGLATAIHGEAKRENDAPQLDLTKLNLDMSACGLDGNQLEQALLQRGIYAELVTGDILMCMTGIGNTREDYRRLLQALEEIASTHRPEACDVPEKTVAGSGQVATTGTAADTAATKTAAAGTAADTAATKTEVAGTDTAHTAAQTAADASTASDDAGSEVTGAHLWTRRRPLHAIPANKERLPIDECAGRICAVSIIPYPPGIPLICPGEEIGAAEIAYVKQLRARGEKVMGIDSQGRVTVGV